jgi:hypothetical protein
MDNMTWPIDSPQEEEAALAKMMATAFYTQFLFPRKALHLFRRYVLLEGAPKRAIVEFQRKYQRLLKIATIHGAGKQLILKNPVNTARIGQLLEQFPEAKFIHIIRCPYDVFKSSRNLHLTLSVLTTLQIIDPKRADETVLTLYEEMMQRYLQDRSAIPEGNLVEVRLEDLEMNPIAELQRIYQTLNLPKYEHAEPAFEAYIASQQSYLKNQLDLSSDLQQQVEQRWKFAFSSFGYTQDS